MQSLDQSLVERVALHEEDGICLAIEKMTQSEWLFFHRPNMDRHGLSWEITFVPHG
ncbi:MAG: hypothetical protein GYA39_09575 [Methanothrix sp.]|nr:hypothetical protein [Methanothrix sp.]